MALMERVATLIRANLNDILDNAEDPEKMLKQVVLDMQNQLLQVKTQVAIAIADQHLLMKKQQEHRENEQKWMHKAETAVAKQQDDLARAAIERAMSARAMAGGFAEQVEDQRLKVDNLKTALEKLQAKLEEAQARTEVLVARHRRARALSRAGKAHTAAAGEAAEAIWLRTRDKVDRAEAVAHAGGHLPGASLDDRFDALEREDEIEKVLSDLKSKRGA